MEDQRPLILVTGATGYVGGRLIPALLDADYRVRCMARDTSRLAGKPWADRVEIVRGDALDKESLDAAFSGVDTAYYLIHSMGSGAKEFESRDRDAATWFGQAASQAGAKRIIYLGGLQPEQKDYTSKHLESRKDTGDALRMSGVPVTEFRAGVIIGSGSLSFELIRYLTERVPVMVTPKWVTTRTQPIAIRTVLEYLVASLGVEKSIGQTYDIGGRDVLTWEDLFRTYARVRRLRRWIIKVPILTPELSARWVNLITPVPVQIARLLISGLRSAVVCTEKKALQDFGVDPISTEVAIRAALERIRDHEITSTWFDAYSSSTEDGRLSVLEDTEGMIIERRTADTEIHHEVLFRVVNQLGGDTGWLYANSLWKFRGFLDQTIGGVGYRRGRRHPDKLDVGDALDFWRVEAIEPGLLLRLRAEMKVPGRAWLQFACQPTETGTRIIQTAFFEPRGLAGLTYWYALYPLHKIIFSGMLNAIVEKAKSPSTLHKDA